MNHVSSYSIAQRRQETATLQVSNPPKTLAVPKKNLATRCRSFSFQTRGGGCAPPNPPACFYSPTLDFSLFSMLSILFMIFPHFSLFLIICLSFHDFPSCLIPFHDFEYFHNILHFLPFSSMLHNFYLFHYLSLRFIMFVIILSCFMISLSFSWASSLSSFSYHSHVKSHVLNFHDFLSLSFFSAFSIICMIFTIFIMLQLFSSFLVILKMFRHFHLCLFIIVYDSSSCSSCSIMKISSCFKFKHCFHFVIMCHHFLLFS